MIKFVVIFVLSTVSLFMLRMLFTMFFYSCKATIKAISLVNDKMGDDFTIALAVKTMNMNTYLDNKEAKARAQCVAALKDAKFSDVTKTLASDLIDQCF